MAAQISEGSLSRGFTIGKTVDYVFLYDVWGTDEPDEVSDLLLETAPLTYLGATRDSATVDPVGAGQWKINVQYIQTPDEDEFTFDTTGGSQKITQSLETVNSYAPPGFTAPDFEGAIGVSEDGVEGVEIPARSFQFTVTHKFSASFVEGGYALTLFNLTGCYNDAAFKGFAAGECLFLGALGSKRGYELYSITYRFACSANVTGKTIGDVTGIDKLGWDYLWIRYSDFYDSIGLALVKRPLAVYVEKVSEPSDFSVLAIGV